MKVLITTLGCKVNQYESQWMKQTLEQQGNQVIGDTGEPCDCVIVNTCAVTTEAERKSMQMLRRMKRQYPHARIVGAGCMAQMNDSKLLSHCDQLIGNQDKDRFMSLIHQPLDDFKLFSPTPYWKDRKLDHCIRSDGDYQRVGVMVEEGCDHGCAYCVIPRARGNQALSKPSRIALEEIKGLVDQGVREIVLTGINLLLYEDRTDEKAGYGLIQLLEDVLELPGSFRIRLSSLNPESNVGDWTYLFRHPKMCRHLHLSIQSGSDSVLKRMNRRYSSQEVRDWVSALRSIDPKFSFSTDMIVGFPGETESDFEDTLCMVDSIGLIKTHIFRFSAREGTPAYSMIDQIDEDLKKRRSVRLKEVAMASSMKARLMHLGTTRSVLMESRSEEGILGHDAYYIAHWIAQDSSLPSNDLVNRQMWMCKINAIDDNYMDRVVSEYVDLSESALVGQ